MRQLRDGLRVTAGGVLREANGELREMRVSGLLDAAGVRELGEVGVGQS